MKFNSESGKEAGKISKRGRGVALWKCVVACTN